MYTNLCMPGNESVLRKVRMPFHLMDSRADFAVRKNLLRLALAEIF